MRHIRAWIVLLTFLALTLGCGAVPSLGAQDAPAEPPETTESPDSALSPEPAGTPEPVLTITLVPPDGWYLNRAEMAVRVQGGEWTRAELQRPDVQAWEDVTRAVREGKIPLHTNGLYRLRFTDPSGGTREAEQEISCFDTTPPTVRAGIREDLLHAEAWDSQSGAAGILVDGRLYTTLSDGVLDLRIRDSSLSGRTISVIAMDQVGNLSEETVLDNPYSAAASPGPTPTPYTVYSGDPNAPAPTQAPAAVPTAPPPVTAQPQSFAGQYAAPTALPAETPAPTVTPEPAVPTAEPTPTAEPLEPYEGTGFASVGPFVTRDMLYDRFTNKLFLTVETRDGSLFYLVVDYDKPLDEEGEAYETYFLNAVDGSDLRAFLPETTEEPASSPEVCICAEKCHVGSVNTDCPVCKDNLSECLGAEPTPEPTPAPAVEEEPANPLGPVVFLLVLAAGGAGIVLLILKRRRQSAPPPAGIDPDDQFPEREEEPEPYEDS